MGNRIERLERVHLADRVFDALATAILRGDFPAGSTLPPERELAAQFETTRIIVRQAIHRLAEVGLVKVQQGAATRVLGLEEVTDVRAIELLYRLGAPHDAEGAIHRDLLEKKYLQGLCLVEAFHRKATASQRAELAQRVASELDAAGPEGFARFEERFWKALADRVGNRILRMEVGWWYRTFGPSDGARPLDPTGVALSAFYRELSRRLVSRSDPVGFYLAVLVQLMAAGVQAPLTQSRNKKGR